MKALLVLLLCLPCIATSHQSEAAPERKIDCTGKLNSFSCLSFKEMLESGDADIKRETSHDESFICFRDSSDTFLIVSYQLPAEMTIPKGSSIAEVIGAVSYARYTKGVSESYNFWFGKWHKLQASEPAEFIGNDKQVSITEAEIGIDFSYSNVAGTTTKYSLSIRKSTHRFVEQMSAGKDKRIGFDGYCAEFK